MCPIVLFVGPAAPFECVSTGLIGIVIHHEWAVEIVYVLWVMWLCGSMFVWLVPFSDLFFLLILGVGATAEVTR